MQSFSKLKPSQKKEPRKNQVQFETGDLQIIGYEGWNFVKEPDMVVCIIYLIEQNKIMMMHEYIPTFKWVDGQEYHLTCISGKIENGDSEHRTLLREIEEEAGIVIDSDFKIEFDKPLYVSKGNSAKYIPAIISLTERDYHEVMAKTDSSKAERKSQAVKLDAKLLSAIVTSDVITELMLRKLKEFLSIS